MYVENIYMRHRELLKDKSSSLYGRIGMNPANLKPDTTIIPGDIVAFIFINEDKGRRSRPY